MLLAEMSTLLKSLAASWVRNGKPSMLTDGLTGTPCDWNWLANSFSVTALRHPVDDDQEDHDHHDDEGDHDRAPRAAPPLAAARPRSRLAGRRRLR